MTRAADNRLGTGWRSSRRGLLRGAATGAAGAAAFAIACGGDDDKETATTEQKQAAAEQALAKPQDTTSQAVPGGEFRSLATADVANFDPGASGTAAGVGVRFYSRLLRFKTGEPNKPATGDVEGDLAERWEQPDPLRMVIKLRSGVVWDERAPTNKRPLDAQDIVYSWKRFEAASDSRRNLVNSLNPAAPIETINALDPQTVEVKLAFPYSALAPTLAFYRYLQIMPREADGGFDPRNDVRGSGPWQLAEYQRSVKFVYKKNPNWHFKDRPFFDTWEAPILSEYAAALAQFRAKRVWTMNVRQEDIADTKKDLPELTLLRNDFDRSSRHLYFGVRPGSPFHDERVRRAVSMMLDRDLLIDAFYNVDKFRAAGMQSDTRWHSHVSSGWDRFWLDPKTDAIGEGKANFQHNPAEAKKLLAAAGHANGLSIDFTYITTGQYGTDYVQQAEALKGMIEASGDIKLRQLNPDYQTEFLPRYSDSRGEFDGIYVAATTIYPDIDSHLFAYYHKAGSTGHVGLLNDGTGEQSYAMIEAQRRELDPNKRTQIVKDWQKYMATKFHVLPFPGQGQTYSLAWPWIGNYGSIRAFGGNEAPAEEYVHWWFDKSKYTG